MILKSEQQSAQKYTEGHSMFKTVPICILTAGHTVDGREVKPETLHQMAEAYNPETYNARINIEHNSYGYKLGSVLSLNVKEVGEKVKLFAELKPNDYLLYFIQQGQKLHTSCEIVMNFAQTGKAYLTGLAVTDNPASLGTTEMHLSAGYQGAEVFTTDSEILQFEQESKAFFKNPFAKKEDEPMDKVTQEMLTQLQAQQAETLKQLESLNARVNGQGQDTEAPATNAGDQATQEETDLHAHQSKLDQLKSDLQTEIETLKTAVEETKNLLTQALKTTDEPARSPADGKGDEDDDAVL